MGKGYKPTDFLGETIKLVIPEISGHPILSISPTGNWQMVEEGVYQYTVDGISRALESGMTTPEFVAEARFYDFTEMLDFTGEVEIIAYAVQTDGFDESASASDIWSTTVQAAGNCNEKHRGMKGLITAIGWSLIHDTGEAWRTKRYGGKSPK